MLKTINHSRLQWWDFWLVVPLLLGLTGPVAAAEPTLVRSSFWVPSERTEEFAQVYRQEMTPLLQHHGLVVAEEPGRETADSVFSRLAEVGFAGRMGRDPGSD